MPDRFWPAHRQRKRPVPCGNRAPSLQACASGCGARRRHHSLDQGKLVETEKIATPSLLETSSGVPSQQVEVAAIAPTSGRT